MDLPISRFVRPASLADALSALAAEPLARPIAGGTDLAVQLRDRRRSAEVLVEVDHLGLDAIRELPDGSLEIGACATMDAIARHPAVAGRHPALAEAAGHVGAWPIQCRATLGGNLGNASPAADTAPPLLVADARVRIAGPGGEREVLVDELFLSPGRTCLLPGELIVAVVMPPPPAGRTVASFTKVGPRAEQVIAVVSLAARATVGVGGALTGVRLALGAVAPRPVRARATEALLEGARPTARVRREAAAALQGDIAPIDDVRAPARYRRMAAAVLLDRFLEGPWPTA